MLDIENKHRVLENKNGELGFTHPGRYMETFPSPRRCLVLRQFFPGRVNLYISSN
jgi:hypothetical protein